MMYRLRRCTDSVEVHMLVSSRISNHLFLVRFFFLRDYASRGATVYATSRRKETITNFESDRIEVLEMDVTSTDSVKVRA